MLTGQESLHELQGKKETIEAELPKLRGAEKKMAESRLQDIKSAMERLKRRGGKDAVQY